MPRQLRWTQKFICFSILFGGCKNSVVKPIPSLGPTINVSSSLKLSLEEPERTNSRPTTMGKTFLVSSSAQLPNCSANQKSAIAYAIGEKKFFLCDGSWSELSSVAEEKSEKERGGLREIRPFPALKLLSRVVVNGATDKCRFQERVAESGFDADLNGELEVEEVANQISTCEGSLEDLANEIFVKNFKSVGFVVSNYVHPFGCSFSSMGAGWLLKDDVVVTNQHVVESSQASVCFGLAGQAQLKSIDVYLPKLALNAEEVLNLPRLEFVGQAASLHKFDEFKAQAIDRVSLSFTNEKADIALIKIGATGRRPLLLNVTSPDAPEEEALNVADEVVTVGYTAETGPLFEVSYVHEIKNCSELMKSFAEGDQIATDCLTSINIRERNILFSYEQHSHKFLSGNPVFDRFGYVVGMQTWSVNLGNTSVGIAQVGFELQRFLTSKSNFLPF